MGQFGSKRKEEPTATEIRRTNPLAKRPKTDDFFNKYASLMKAKGVLPDIFLVHEAPSAQYVDEDGDVANEFYQETMSEGEKRRLCRLVENIRPKGKERYTIPRLSADVPLVMWEVKP
ncbi:unnamed protein product [Caenorhabditis auriculariae]|uniref:Uncharacterized protein n=1 Tax=Caenorhabditis auriculariae TaxID=2777116 RepID=A0A8S1HET4_9PELO|nr:unnamed protein product [Caenorhabditis auriculariae]